jgi:hypothetical protein
MSSSSSTTDMLYLLFSSSSFIYDVIQNENPIGDHYILSKVQSLRFLSTENNSLIYEINNNEDKLNHNGKKIKDVNDTDMFYSSKGYVKLKDNSLYQTITQNSKKISMEVIVSVTIMDKLKKDLPIIYKTITYTGNPIQEEKRRISYEHKHPSYNDYKIKNYYSISLTCSTSSFKNNNKEATTDCVSSSLIPLNFTFFDSLPQLISEIYIPQEFVPCDIYSTDAGNNESPHFTLSKYGRLGNINLYQLLGFDNARTLIIEPHLGVGKKLQSIFTTVEHKKHQYKLSEFKSHANSIISDDVKTTYYGTIPNLRFIVQERHSYKGSRDVRMLEGYINDYPYNSQFFIFGKNTVI